jgi:hypothetical protein
MEELLELKEMMINHQYDEAFSLIEDIEEMSKEDKLNKIDSFAVILMEHLIKQTIENRTSRSWTLSINNSIREINKINKRKKSGGSYANDNEIYDILNEAFYPSLQRASINVFEGRYDENELDKMIDRLDIIRQAFDLIRN